MKQYILILLCGSLFLLSTNAIFAQKNIIEGSGKYYDLKGKPHEGYLFYQYGPQKLKFREQSTDSKYQKLKPWKIKGFVIEADSFAILEDFDIEQLDGIKEHRIMDYVMVSELGKIILYKHTAVGSRMSADHTNPAGTQFGFQGGEKIENYLIKFEKATSVLLVKKANQKKFKKQLTQFFEGYPEYQSKIQEAGFYWSNVPDLIREFNSTQ